MPGEMHRGGGGIGMGPNDPPRSPAMMPLGGRPMGGDEGRVREMSKELDTLKSDLEQTRRTLAQTQGAPVSEDPQPKAASSVALVFSECQASSW